MAGARPAALFILKYIDKMIPGSPNTQLFKEKFDAMSDKEFDAYIDRLESGEEFIPLTVPNYNDMETIVERNLNIGEELGHTFFEQLWIEGKGDDPTYLTPVPYLIVDLPWRRASQLLTKKISVPKNNGVVDALTGQVTGESKGAKISKPELELCGAMGLDNAMVELMKHRGGDARGNAALTGMMSKYGKAQLSVLNQYASGVESTKTLKTYLTACHIKNNLHE